MEDFECNITVRMYLNVSSGDIVLLLKIFAGAHFSFDRLGFKFTFGSGPTL